MEVGGRGMGRGRGCWSCAGCLGGARRCGGTDSSTAELAVEAGAVAVGAVAMAMGGCGWLWVAVGGWG